MSEDKEHCFCTGQECTFDLGREKSVSVLYRIVLIRHVNTQYCIKSPLAGTAYLYG